MGIEEILDVEWAKKMLEERNAIKSSGGNSEISWARLPDDGMMKFRILPTGYGEKKIGFLKYTHYNMPEGSEGSCLHTWKLECPTCEVVKKYANLMNMDAWSRAGKAYFNVLIYENNEYNSGNPYLMGTPEYTFYWLLDILVSPDYGNILDPVKGHNIKFTRKTKGGAFTREVLIQPTAIATSEEGIKTIIDKAYDCVKIWRSPDDKFVENIKKGAAALDIILKSKINSISSLNSSNTVNTVTSISTTTPIELAATTPPLVIAQSSKPDKSPDCFGISFDGTTEKCIMCSYDYLCMKEKK